MLAVNELAAAASAGAPRMREYNATVKAESSSDGSGGGGSDDIARRGAMTQCTLEETRVPHFKNPDTGVFYTIDVVLLKQLARRTVVH